MIMVIVRLFRSVTVLCLHRRMGDRGTSNGDYRRAEKIRRHWLLSTRFLSSVTAILFVFMVRSIESSELAGSKFSTNFYTKGSSFFLISLSVQFGPKR